MRAPEMPATPVGHQPSVRQLLGRATMVTGKLSFNAPTRIEGVLNADVRVSDLLVIREEGKLDRAVRARQLLVLGEVRGRGVGAGPGGNWCQRAAFWFHPEQGVGGGSWCGTRRGLQNRSDRISLPAAPSPSRVLAAVASSKAGMRTENLRTPVGEADSVGATIAYPYAKPRRTGVLLAHGAGNDRFFPLLSGVQRNLAKRGGLCAQRSTFFTKSADAASPTRCRFWCKPTEKCSGRCGRA